MGFATATGRRVPVPAGTTWRAQRVTSVPPTIGIMARREAASPVAVTHNTPAVLTAIWYGISVVIFYNISLIIFK